MGAPEDDLDSTMVIRDLLPNITTVSIPFKRSGIFQAGGRATIVRLASGNLAVFSPTPLTSGVRDKIEALSSTASSSVAYLIAPDLEHHVSLYQWHQAYPGARVLAPAGLAEKRAKDKKYAKEPVPITDPIEQQDGPHKISAEFDADFALEYVSAHMNKEIVLLHRPTRTLIQADMLWNLPPTEQYSRTPGGVSGGLMQRLATVVFGAGGTQALGQRRLLWWGVSAGDRAGFNHSVQRIDAWDFENMVGCHGDVVLGTGKSIFEKVFRWHLDAAEGKAAAGKAEGKFT